MQVRVRLYGTLRRLSQPATPGLWEGEIPDGLTIAGLVTLLGTRLEELAAAAIDGVPAGFDEMIPPNAEVTLVTPVGGG